MYVSATATHDNAKHKIIMMMMMMMVMKKPARFIDAFFGFVDFLIDRSLGIIF